MAEKKYYQIKALTNGAAEVWIYEQIGEDWFSEGVTAKKFCQDLAALKADSIDLHINSPGGSVFDGQAIYNALVRHPANITTYIDGLAASIASVIALAGNKVVMADNALFMIHNPWGVAQGSADDMRKCADVLDKCRDTIVNVYAHKCGLGDDAIMSAMDDETWMTAEEARTFGFVDEITSGQQLAALGRFDLKALGFKKVPKQEAVIIPAAAMATPGCHDNMAMFAQMPCEMCDLNADCNNPNCTTEQSPAASVVTTTAPAANKETVTMPEETTVPVNGAKEAADIVTMCVQNGCADKAAEYITAGFTADQVGRAILASMANKPVVTPAAEHAKPQRIRVIERYNPQSLDAFRPTFKQDAEKAAYEAGMWARAVLFQDPRAQTWCRDSGLDINFRAAMGEQSGTSGGYLVPDSLEAAIINLRVQYGAARRLCRIIPMGSASTTIPVRTGGTTAYFGGENPDTGVKESEMSWGQAELVAKNLNALTRISNNLIEDAVIDVGAMVADEHAYAFAGKEDACMVIGDGSSTYGGIMGLNKLFEANYSTLKGCIAAASNTDTPQEIIAAELSSVMGRLPSYARVGATWLSSPTFDEMIFSRLMAAGGGNTTITLAGDITPAYLGKRREINEFMPSDSTADLTNLVAILYGNFKPACLIGDRRGIIIQVLREKYAEYNQIGVLGTERIDMNFRHAIGDSTKAGSVCALIGG